MATELPRTVLCGPTSCCLEDPMPSTALDVSELIASARACYELYADGPPVRLAHWALVNYANSGTGHHLSACGPAVRVVGMEMSYEKALLATARMARFVDSRGLAWNATTHAIPTGTCVHIPASKDETYTSTASRAHVSAVLNTWQSFQRMRGMIARAQARGMLPRSLMKGFLAFATLPERVDITDEVPTTHEAASSSFVTPPSATSGFIPLAEPPPAALTNDLADGVPLPCCLVSVLRDTTVDEHVRRGDARWIAQARALRVYALEHEPHGAAALGWNLRLHDDGTQETPAEELDVLVPRRRVFVDDAHVRPVVRIYPFVLASGGAGSAALRDAAARLVMDRVADMDVTTLKLWEWEYLEFAPGGVRKYRESVNANGIGSYANRRRGLRDNPVSIPCSAPSAVEQDAVNTACLLPCGSREFEAYVSVEGRTLRVPPYLQFMFPTTVTLTFAEFLERFVSAFEENMIGPATELFLEAMTPNELTEAGGSWRDMMFDDVEDVIVT